jgi:hypothetical protein
MVGVLVMGILVPVTLFFLLGLHTFSQFFTVAACTLLPWGVADLLAGILERPRLSDRSPTRALREDWDRRKGE